MPSYSSLTARALPRHATFSQPNPPSVPVTLRDPATAVMTDLKKVSTVTIDPDASIEDAMRLMVRKNVRLLLVVNIDNEIQGVITATDLLGEKPLLYVREFGGSRADIPVREIMTPQARLEILDYAEVRLARVGNVVATLARSRRQHALVADYDEYGTPTVRGIFSASQCAKQLGHELQTGEVLYSFADIEAALNHN